MWYRQCNRLETRRWPTVAALAAHDDGRSVLPVSVSPVYGHRGLRGVQRRTCCETWPAWRHAAGAACLSRRSSRASPLLAAYRTRSGRRVSAHWHVCQSPTGSGKNEEWQDGGRPADWKVDVFDHHLLQISVTRQDIAAEPIHSSFTSYSIELNTFGKSFVSDLWYFALT